MNNLRIRKKLKTSEISFAFEVNLIEIVDVPKALSYGWIKISDKEKKNHVDALNLISIVKSSIPKYKIITKTTRVGKIKFKILLNNEVDIMLLTLAASNVIERIYQYESK